MLPTTEHSSTDVPPEILNEVIKDARLYINVINAGPMATTGLDQEAASRKGLVKNHWEWRTLTTSFRGQIAFGFEPVTISSDEAQYIGSSHVGSGSNYTGSSSVGSEVYSEVGSVGKLPADIGKSQSDSTKGDIVVTSDSKGVPIAPTMPSPDSSLIPQPIEGAPVPGFLSIKVRHRQGASLRTCLTRSFHLRPGTSFGELLNAMVSRHMEPFRFRKINSAILGCRDGISQASAAWLADGLMLDPVCIEEPHHHIYDLLGWRYSRPSVSMNLSNSDEDSAEMTQGSARSVNAIDRAIWPLNYIHVEDAMLQYNQLPLDA